MEKEEISVQQLEKLLEEEIERKHLNRGAQMFRAALYGAQTGKEIIRILNHWIAFNKIFGACVAGLAGIVASRFGYQAAKLIFFAAIDEMGGAKCGTTHDEYALAFGLETARFFGLDFPKLVEDFASSVEEGYGLGRQLSDREVLGAMGFGWAAERSAGRKDGEFTITHEWLREEPQRGLASHLKQTHADLWVKLHSSLGGKVEDVHADFATRAGVLAINACGTVDDPLEAYLEGVRKFYGTQIQFMETLLSN
jgi:hypothetical protein